MGLDLHRSLFQIIFHLLVSERTYSDCENHLYFDVIERFLWIVYYVLSILAIAVVLLCYGRCQKVFGGMRKSKVEVVLPANRTDSTIQTNEDWAVIYRQNDELRTRSNIQHRRLKKMISGISNKRVQPKKPIIKPVTKVSRWRRRKGNSKPSDGCIKMLLETKQQLQDRLNALSRMYTQAVQLKKDLKCALSTSENQLFQNNRDAQLNWIQWQAAQRTIAETTTKALKMKSRLEEKKDCDADAPSDGLVSASSSFAGATDADRKCQDSSNCGTNSRRHRNPTGDAGLSVSMDDAQCTDSIGDSLAIESDSTAGKLTKVRDRNNTTCSGGSPDRFPVGRRSFSTSPSRVQRNDSLERRGRSAGQYLRGPASSKSPVRSSGSNTANNACVRLRSSFSPERSVGVVSGMVKAAERHIAAVYPERRFFNSPEGRAKAAEGVSYLTKSQECRRVAATTNNSSVHNSPERRRFSAPHCSRLNTSADRRCVSSIEHYSVGGPGQRRSDYLNASQQRAVSPDTNRTRQW